jgi:hypothetical protein
MGSGTVRLQPSSGNENTIVAARRIRRAAEPIPRGATGTSSYASPNGSRRCEGASLLV